MLAERHLRQGTQVRTATAADRCGQRIGRQFLLQLQATGQPVDERLIELQGDTQTSHEPAQVVGWHAEVLSRLCQEAAEVVVTVVLEHVPQGGGEQLENIVAIMEGVPLLRFHLDSGHAKLERGYDRWDEYLDKLGPKLLHVHLSENDGTADQHLPLGAAPRSTTDWPQHVKKLRATGHDGTITLEVFSRHKEYLLLSRDLLRRWWDEV